jgi:putative methylase
MKQKQLEIFLQQIPSHPAPVPQLEQYPTPASIAADILFTAFHFQDIKGLHLADYGCGTGIFATGATLLGAKKVCAIDIDTHALQIAQEFAQAHNLTITFIHSSIEHITKKCDTVLMNPPFGAQFSNRNTDRVFLSTALKNATVVYSLHLTKTRPFITKIVHGLQGTITTEKEYLFPISHQFHFHTKKMVTYPVTLFRILKRNNPRKNKSQ